MQTSVINELHFLINNSIKRNRLFVEVILKSYMMMTVAVSVNVIVLGA